MWPWVSVYPRHGRVLGVQSEGRELLWWHKRGWESLLVLPSGWGTALQGRAGLLTAVIAWLSRCLLPLSQEKALGGQAQGSSPATTCCPACQAAVAGRWSQNNHTKGAGGCGARNTKL